MKEKIIEWAKQEDSIRAVILLGSRARDPQPDPLADYDINIFTSNIQNYTRNDHWLSHFGTPWVCVHEKVYWKERQFPSRLAILEGGVKLDFSFYALDVLEEIANEPSLSEFYRGGYVVWLDKDQMTAQIPKTNFNKIAPQKPSEEEFNRIVNEFWFEAYHVAVYLKREALWQAKFRAGGICDQFLLKMIEWNELAKAEFVKDIPPKGKRMQTWVNKSTWVSLFKVFAHFDSKDSWNALMHTMELFRNLAIETAQKLGYHYPSEVDRNISGFILKLRDNQSDGLNSD